MFDRDGDDKIQGRFFHHVCDVIVFFEMLAERRGFIGTQLQMSPEDHMHVYLLLNLVMHIRHITPVTKGDGIIMYS